MYEALKEFVKPELLVLVPVMYLFGVMFAKSEIKNKYIPSLLGCISIVLCLMVVLSSASLDRWQDFMMAAFSGITQGVICAGVSVYFDQIVKQRKKDD